MAATSTHAEQASATAGSMDVGHLQAAFQRIEIYSLLAALFRQPPNADLLASLADLAVPEQAVDEPKLIAAWRGLRLAAQVADRDAVDDEFHQLFIGMGRGEVLPYASWYLSGFLMDRPLVALRSDLSRLHITRNDDNREPEDHAAALCETMALLADPAQGVDGAEQRKFLLMHITPWMGRLFADIATADTAEFYRAVAALGAAFIEVEQSWLSLP